MRSNWEGFQGHYGKIAMTTKKHLKAEVILS